MMGVMASLVVADMEVRAQPHDFGAWMQAEQKRVFLLCYRLLADCDEADTATQEVFLKAYRAMSRENSEAPQQPSKWLTRIAVNTCLDRLRSHRWQFWRRRPGPEEERAALELAPSVEPSAEEQFFARQIGSRISAALGRLSLRQRAVFMLRHYEDRSLEEIAGILELNVGTVKAHMARAVAKLRLELKDLYGRQALERR
jgi:RNA polymerase sigma-70 factor (ECF subfamily)